MLFFHFLFCFLTVFLTFGSLIAPSAFFEIPTEYRAGRVFVAMWCLVGIALIFFAYYGIRRKFESLIRLYFIYAAICCFADMAYIVKTLVMPGCSSMPSLLTSQGDAFACGVVRSANLGVVFVLTLAQAYFLFILWSLCEDMAEGGTARLSDLAIGMTDDKIRKQRHDLDARTSLVGMPGGPGGARMGSWGGSGGGGGAGYPGESGGYGGYGGGGSGGYGGGGGQGGGYGSRYTGPIYDEPGGYGNINPNYDTSIMGKIFGDDSQQMYNSRYDHIAADGLTGSRRIFDGRYHEMQYPPPTQG